MLVKRLLICLATLGAVGGTGAGIYYLKNQTAHSTVSESLVENLPTAAAPGVEASAQKGTEQAPQQDQRSTIIVTPQPPNPSTQPPTQTSQTVTATQQNSAGSGTVDAGK